jgi:hypothetical protein
LEEIQPIFAKKKKKKEHLNPADQGGFLPTPRHGKVCLFFFFFFFFSKGAWMIGKERLPKGALENVKDVYWMPHDRWL